jgi:hypothetical protein
MMKPRLAAEDRSVGWEELRHDKIDARSCETTSREELVSNYSGTAPVVPLEALESQIVQIVRKALPRRGKQ